MLLFYLPYNLLNKQSYYDTDNAAIRLSKHYLSNLTQYGEIDEIQYNMLCILVLAQNNETRLSTIFQLKVKILGNDTSPSDAVQNLGVIFDSDFCFHQSISQVCKSCFYHTRDFRRIRLL